MLVVASETGVVRQAHSEPALGLEGLELQIQTLALDRRTVTYLEPLAHRQIPSEIPQRPRDSGLEAVLYSASLRVMAFSVHSRPPQIPMAYLVRVTPAQALVITLVRASAAQVLQIRLVVPQIKASQQALSARRTTPLALVALAIPQAILKVRILSRPLARQHSGITMQHSHQTPTCLITLAISILRLSRSHSSETLAETPIHPPLRYSVPQTTTLTPQAVDSSGIRTTPISLQAVASSLPRRQIILVVVAAAFLVATTPNQDRCLAEVRARVLALVYLEITAQINYNRNHNKALCLGGAAVCSGTATRRSLVLVRCLVIRRMRPKMPIFSETVLAPAYSAHLRMPNHSNRVCRLHFSMAILTASPQYGVVFLPPLLRIPAR